MAGAIITKDWRMKCRDEADISIKEAPYQALKKTVTSRAVDARMKAAKGAKEKWQYLDSVDKEVMDKATSRLTEEERTYLTVLHNGGGYDKERIREQINAEEDTTCKHC